VGDAQRTGATRGSCGRVDTWRARPMVVKHWRGLAIGTLSIQRGCSGSPDLLCVACIALKKTGECNRLASVEKKQSDDAVLALGTHCLAARTR
jgi:hypothetical protein